jgi:anhydro-N-acetylmuramic acid kinase
MRVIGMMSGTSADGIDAALLRIEGAPPALKIRLEGHSHVAFRAPLRRAILELANGCATSTRDISNLNFALGEEFGRAAITACKRWRVPMSQIDLIGSHGQTIFHQGELLQFLGTGRVASTLQIGEPSIIAAWTGVDTMADFRPADIAAGGQGAPLVPFVDYLLYRDLRRGRAALNIGGIANVTVIPARAKPQEVFAFDTGPGNMIVDALVDQISGGSETYDKDARMALGGRLSQPLLHRLMLDRYLQRKPPKTAGREQFGQTYAAKVASWGAEQGVAGNDLVHTATVFTALSIAAAFRQFVFPRAKVKDLIVAGGGTRNPLLMAQLVAALPELEIHPSSEFGVPEDAKEALAFAVLAYEAYHGRVNNIPAATGARRTAVMGKLVRGRNSRRGKG